ncbi:MAG TPA: hypothetical protein VFY92_05680, partial [Hyphomicrobiaceae bacterium]|nr:hypothetical protein [Hyphomicrobiaceae bacterium]
APGRRLKQEPANRRNRVACGLDRDGRMMVERQFNEIAFYETFYDWTADAIEAAHFDYADEKAPVNLMRARMRDNCIVAADKAAVHGYTREAYLWEDGRVVAVEVHHARREGGALAPLRPWHTARVHYGEDGVLMRVEHVWPAAVVRREQDLVEIMFERRGKTIYRNHP